MHGTKESKIIKKTYLILLVFSTVSCQKNENPALSKINSLPSSLNEISGIVQLSDNNLYAINDSGNSNVLFQLTPQGKLIKTIKLPGTKNIDWEDLAYDQEDNIYIGDFGNNANKRKDLMIYKVSGITTNNISVSSIEFFFEDQAKFPPKKKKLNFDVEAFIYLNNHFYLFTKNRGDISKFTTKLYKLSAIPGKQIAKYIGSYKTCEDKSDCLITGASINNAKDRIALLTHNKVFLLNDFKSDNLFDATIEKIKLHHNSQKESICFKNDSILLIADEKSHQSKGDLYQYLLD